MKTRQFSICFLICCVLLLTSGTLKARERQPEVGESLRSMQGRTYYLAYNLHADITFNKISSVNYQLRGGLIPWGTEVKVIRFGRNNLIFEDLSNKRQYSYEFHWKTRRAVKLSDHLNRLFVNDVKALKAKVNQLSEVDKDGIYEGRVRLGMSRQGVLIAIGFPPEFATKDPLSARQWQYWRNRWGKMTVLFGRNDKVSEIVGYD